MLRTILCFIVPIILVISSCINNIIFIFTAISPDLENFVLPVPNNETEFGVNDESRLEHTIKFAVSNNINPCENFYYFVCSNITDKTKSNLYLRKIQNEELIKIYMEKIEEDDHRVTKAAKRLFQSCMDEEAIETDGLRTIKQMLKDLGGWPLNDDNWNESYFDWNRIFAKLREIGILESIFKVDYRLKQVSLVEKDFFNDKNKEIMINLAKVFGAKDDKNIKEAYECMHHTWKIIKEVEDEDKGSLNTIIGNNLDYVHYLNYPDSIDSPLDSPKSTKQYWTVKGLQGIYYAPTLHIATYIMWMVVYELGPLLNQEVRNAMGIENHNRADFCLSETEKRFKLSPIHLLADQRYSTQTDMEEVKEFLDELKGTFMRLVDDYYPKLEDSVRNIIDSRISNITVIVGGFARFYDSDELFFKQDVELNSPLYNGVDTFLTRSLQVNRNYEAPKLKDEFNVEYLKNYNITYLEESNVLFVPRVVVQKFYHKGFPRYFNLATLGTMVLTDFLNILGKVLLVTDPDGRRPLRRNNVGYRLGKIYHLVMSFDEDKGRTFVDLTGHNEFLRAIEAIHDAYTLFAEISAEVDFTLLLNGKNYTSNQLFWISWANTMCSGENNDLADLNNMKLFVLLRILPEIKYHFNCPSKSMLEDHKMFKNFFKSLKFVSNSVGT